MSKSDVRVCKGERERWWWELSTTSSVHDEHSHTISSRAKSTQQLRPLATATALAQILFLILWLTGR